ncbi:DUF2272 domain-containing protein [Desulfobulbus sp.]|uniref:DUF2272 domain-containing protein n=1 Tax=Desulfobulbus sp. TaxID=895 RepID=UPI0027B9C82C|nr:DUF2272 domain-containing protein [Desulfobulbus sp.]
MPASKKQLVDSATAEWVFWGKSVWNVAKKTATIGHKDDEESFAQYVVDNYCSVGGGNPSLFDIQNDEYAWSAVGMSAIMKNAGFTVAEFPFSQSHSTYIRAFIKARLNEDQSAAYWGYRLGEPGGEPDVGDLVGYARGEGLTHEKAQKYFDKKTSYKSHIDIVVARRATEIDVIGANVLDSVTKKTLTISTAGHISDTQHFWFVTLKKR